MFLLRLGDVEVQIIWYNWYMQLKKKNAYLKKCNRKYSWIVEPYLPDDFHQYIE